jgi:nitrate reductase NapD
MPGPTLFNRRDVLLGKPGGGHAREHHISSAVVRAIPSKLPDVLAQIAAIEGVEVVAAENGRIVLVLEGESSGVLGERLTAINLLEGVLAASMVFEHSEQLEQSHGDGAVSS